MKMSTYAVAAIAMASGLAAAAMARTRDSQAHVSPGTPNVAREMERKGGAGTLPSSGDEDFLKWIPLVVPLLAVMLAIGAYIIVGAMAL